ncbi:MAG: DUF4114 domain-containing protein, partial [Cyanobacteria bacterium J06649_11]
HVQDERGTIIDTEGNSILPEEANYLQTILDSSTTQVIFSTLNTSDNLPNNFVDLFGNQLEFLDSELNIEANGQTNQTLLGFGLVINATFDDLGQSIDEAVFLSTLNQASVSNLSTDSFTLAFSDDVEGKFDDLNFEVTSATLDTLISLNNSDEALDIGTIVHIESASTFAEAIDLVNLQFDTDGDDIADDLTGQTLNVNIDLFREAALNNSVGFYVADSITGAVNGVLPTAANRIAYAEAVFNSSAGVFSAPADENSIDITVSLEIGNLILPFLIVDSSVPNADFSNMYFSFLDLNTDGVDHIRLLGQGVFGFEDLPNGGDKDFDDIIIQITSVELV